MAYSQIWIANEQNQNNKKNKKNVKNENEIMNTSIIERRSKTLSRYE
jgi:hypothetical protein